MVVEKVFDLVICTVYNHFVFCFMSRVNNVGVCSKICGRLYKSLAGEKSKIGDMTSRWGEKQTLRTPCPFSFLCWHFLPPFCFSYLL